MNMRSRNVNLYKYYILIDKLSQFRMLQLKFFVVFFFFPLPGLFAKTQIPRKNNNHGGNADKSDEFLITNTLETTASFPGVALLRK